MVFPAISPPNPSNTLLRTTDSPLDVVVRRCRSQTRARWSVLGASRHAEDWTDWGVAYRQETEPPGYFIRGVIFHQELDRFLHLRAHARSGLIGQRSDEIHVRIEEVT